MWADSEIKMVEFTFKWKALEENLLHGGSLVIGGVCETVGRAAAEVTRILSTAINVIFII